jgi:hypothetical protein
MAEIETCRANFWKEVFLMSFDEGDRELSQCAELADNALELFDERFAAITPASKAGYELCGTMPRKGFSV